MYRGFTRFLTLFGVFLGGWLGVKFLLPVTMPFLLGLGLALAAEPLARPLRRRVGASAAAVVSVALSFCVLALGAVLAGAFALGQLKHLAAALPDMERAARTGFDLAQTKLLALADRAPGSIRTLMQRNVSEAFSDGSALLDHGVQWVLSLAGNALSHVPDSALTLLTALVAAVLISARLPKLGRWLARKLSRERVKAILAALKRVRRGVGGWLLAQGKLMAVSFAIVLTGLLLLRLPNGPIWALLICFVDAFPILGTGAVLLPWSAVRFLQGDSPRALGLVGIWVTVSVVRSVLEPKLLGRELGLDPLVTLMALYAGYKLMGIPGLIFAPLLTVTATQFLPEEKL